MFKKRYDVDWQNTRPFVLALIPGLQFRRRIRQAIFMHDEIKLSEPLSLMKFNQVTLENWEFYLTDIFETI